MSLWLRQKDMNTRFFHQRAKNRKSKNFIKWLSNKNGTWRSDDRGIETTVLNYFEDLFIAHLLKGGEEVLQTSDHRVTPDINLSLKMPVLAEEIQVALFNMHISTALGLDGMSHFFFQRFWPIVRPDVTDVIQCLFYSGRLLKQINYTHVCLIPKMKAPKYITQFRPISLCSILFKIASKVMANRLKRILTHIISHAHSAFVMGKLILDNSLLASKISHFLSKRCQGKKGFLSLKLDISKAYDKIE
ncbi:hypothetical protein ACFX2G_033535 [Malus domestica]